MAPPKILGLPLTVDDTINCSIPPTLVFCTRGECCKLGPVHLQYLHSTVYRPTERDSRLAASITSTNCVHGRLIHSFIHLFSLINSFKSTFTQNSWKLPNPRVPRQIREFRVKFEESRSQGCVDVIMIMLKMRHLLRAVPAILPRSLLGSERRPRLRLQVPNKASKIDRPCTPFHSPLHPPFSPSKHVTVHLRSLNLRYGMQILAFSCFLRNGSE